MTDEDQPADDQAQAGADPSGVDVGGVTDAIQDETGEAFAGTVRTPDGQELPVTLSDDIVQAVRASDDVSLDDVRAAAVPDDVQVNDWAVTADTRRDDTATIPVMDDRQSDLAHNLRGSDSTRYINDPQIRRLIENSVTYSERVGKFLLEQDDLIPAVKERIKSLITGEDGLDVKPADPDDEADQRLAEHLEDLYARDVHPGDVIDSILNENLMSARAVLRSTDLAELDLTTLTYYKDGVTGEEVYVQDTTTVYEFDITEPSDADGNGDIDLNQRSIDKQPLVIGDQVFDISLYDSPPLKAVADTAVNKMVLQRLKARKAEIASFGAVYASVEPPSYLPEDQYFDRVKDEDFDGDGTPPTKLERALKQNIQSAFDTLKDFQNGTVMSVPDSWSLEQLEVPDTDEPIDEQIRGYNRDIARRMLVPLDLLELREGAEMSRETLFKTLMTTIAGWRREIVRIFDQFAQVQADIHDLNGDVEHTFPPLEEANSEHVIQSLQYAGIAGLSEREVRQMLNGIQGVDLDVQSDTGDTPPAGGPDDPQNRGDQMAQFLDDQNQRGRQDAQDDADADADQGPPKSREEAMRRGWSPTGDVDTDAQGADACPLHADKFTPPEGLDLYELDGWDQTSVWRAFISLGGQHSTCTKEMAGEIRNPDAWCAALKDQALGTDLWRKGSASAQQVEASQFYETVQAADFSIDYEGSLSALADIVESVLDANGGDPSRLMEQDDFVAFNLGDADPTDEDPDGDFEPVTVIDGGDQFQVAGLSRSDDLLDGLDDRLEAGAALTAAHGFSGYETLREASQYVRGVVERQLDEGMTVEMRKTSSDRFRLLVRDRQGNFQGSVIVTRSSTDDEDWLVTGTQDFFDDLSRTNNFRRLDAAVALAPSDPSLGDRIRAGLSKTIGVGGTPLDPQDEGERQAYRDGLMD